jgi:hypothetical protein
MTGYMFLKKTDGDFFWFLPAVPVIGINFGNYPQKNAIIQKDMYITYPS